MIFLEIRMVVAPEKQQELLQTFHAVLSRVRKERGCQSSLLVRDTENESLLFLLEIWDTQRNLDRHFRAENFGILLGAVNLLSRETEMKCHALSYTAGAEAVTAARAKKRSEGNGS
jgi:quinol monooxygenase YgiN